MYTFLHNITIVFINIKFNCLKYMGEWFHGR